MEKSQRRREQQNQAAKRWRDKNPDYIKNWARENPDKVNGYLSTYHRRKWATDPEYREKKTEAERKRRLKLQVDAVQHYGGRCYCCGETIPKLLTLDHINDDGSSHRKELNGMRLGEWAKRNNYPEGILRVACYNCNYGRYRNGGVCPHEDMKGG